MDGFTLLKDPLGNEVRLPSTITELDGSLREMQDIFDDVCTVIEKPSLLFQLIDGSIEQYYFRAIGWNKTMLIGAERKEGFYQAFTYEMDPPKDRIAQLFSLGKQVL
jgi:hypothetical protein